MGETKALALFPTNEAQSLHNAPPIISSYNTQIRPLLDAVDKLRHLEITNEGIQLPTIVVVGDQSSGKSSVLESLAGISLPRGDGICTRVPLIMRLQNDPSPTPIMSLKYNRIKQETDEANVALDIISATEEIAGKWNGISNAPLTLEVKKNGVPDLTMVDLPGIIRVAVEGQPDDIDEQVRVLIMKYIAPAESIILNVLPATADFATCGSIKMSREVDKSGERTLAVVTKVDKAPEGLFEKVTTDDVKIGLGYVCVRNRIGDESYEEARAKEALLFDSHALLSKIDKSIVGIPKLAQKLSKIQTASIVKCLPEMVKQINDKLKSNMSELNSLPKHLSSTTEAMTLVIRIVGRSKESLRKILVMGEYEEYPNEAQMHCTARLMEYLNEFSDCIINSWSVADEVPSGGADTKFLLEEIQVIEEAKGIRLPNFVPRSAFLTLLQKKMNHISAAPEDFMCKVWDYTEKIVLIVLGQHSDKYPQLQFSLRRAAQNLIAKLKELSLKRIKEQIQMETLSDYTCNPEYMTQWNKLMGYLPQFIKLAVSSSTNTMNIEGFGSVEVGQLQEFRDTLETAFDMKMRVESYWKIVRMRLVDFMALHLRLSIHNLVEELEAEVIGELMGGTSGGASQIEKLMEESPAVAEKREKLTASIEKLKESKDLVANIMGRIV